MDHRNQQQEEVYLETPLSRVEVYSDKLRLPEEVASLELVHQSLEALYLETSLQKEEACFQETRKHFLAEDLQHRAYSVIPLLTYSPLLPPKRQSPTTVVERRMQTKTVTASTRAAIVLQPSSKMLLLLFS